MSQPQDGPRRYREKRRRTRKLAMWRASQAETPKAPAAKTAAKK